MTVYVGDGTLPRNPEKKNEEQSVVEVVDDQDATAHFLRQDLHEIQDAAPGMDVIGALASVMANPQTALGMHLDEKGASQVRATVSGLVSGYIQYKGGGLARKVSSTYGEPTLGAAAHFLSALLSQKVWR